ncbi:hypothetical protein G3V96_30675, partial [Escherichia coli]|nr:hypothetical protein [Escherichia coli]
MNVQHIRRSAKKQVRTVMAFTQHVIEKGAQGSRLSSRSALEAAVDCGNLSSVIAVYSEDGAFDHAQYLMTDGGEFVAWGKLDKARRLLNASDFNRIFGDIG